MPEEVNAGAGSAASGTTVGGSTGTSQSSGSNGGGATDYSKMSDTEILNAPDAAQGGDGAAASADGAAQASEAAKAAEKTGEEEINLKALEDGDGPEWLAKVTDETIKPEIQKLLDLQKKFTERFKDAEDLEAFFKDLPGGREEVAAMQTLAKEVGELDEAIEGSDFAGHLSVAERVLNQAPENAVSITRAWAQTLAKQNPEAWRQISGELIDSTLKQAGVGADVGTLLGAISEMRAALQKDDGEAFGKAAAKLLGAPQTEAKGDPNLERARQEAENAKQSTVRAQTETWQFRSEKSGDKLSAHINTEAGKFLAKALPSSIGDSERTRLRESVYGEVMAQLTSDAWLASNVKLLIGWAKDNGKGGGDYSNAVLNASQADWDKTTQMIMERATPDMIRRATAKVVTQFSRDRAAKNAEARERAKSGGNKTDVGAGKTASSGNGRKPLTADQLMARREDGSFVLSDKDILNS